jgi:hypothetical protein
MTAMDFAFIGFNFGMATMLFIWRIWVSGSEGKKRGLPNCPDPPPPPKVKLKPPRGGTGQSNICSLSQGVLTDSRVAGTEIEN